jgi:hemolysin activation/secretion protein
MGRAGSPRRKTLARDPGHTLRRLAQLGSLAALCAAAGSAGAQPFDRPVQERPELPGFAEEEAQELPAPPESLLPALPVPELPELRVRVRGYRVRGGTVFTPEEVEETLAPWVGREIGSRDLLDMRNALTQRYVEAGYVNSGAVIPDQDMADGFIEIALVEGALSSVHVTGTRYYRPGVLERRIAAGVGTPLRVQEIQRALELMQQDPRIERVHARLSPGERAGEAVLSLRVEEASPYRVSLDASNYEPVAFGSYRGRVALAHENLLGLGDTLESRFQFSAGLFRYGGDYEIPVTPWGTTAFARGEFSRSTVIEEDFEELDIETDYSSVRLGFEHPVYRSPRSRVALGLYGEWRRSTTDLLGSPFSFPGSGSVDGVTTVSAMRLTADFLRRERNQVIAARSLLSFGMPVLGARGSGVTPDGEFLAWLGQFQWARRFDFMDLQTILRTDVQIASDALPTLEQFAVGGHLTVRGYRENQLVRDQGVISSLELRVPLWRQERPILELAPFADFGWSDNRKRPTSDPDFLASVGVGLRWSITPALRAQAYWGHQLEDVTTLGGDLQDDGFQFGVVWDAF